MSKEYEKYRIKKALPKDSIEYRLLEMYVNELLPKESVANVIAIDNTGKLLWVIEKPTTAHDIYADIYFKSGKLLAFSSGGQLHEIDESTGKVISSKMLK